MYQTGEQKQSTYDMNNNQYVFADMDDRGWNFPRHRFQITCKNSNFGQYLTSSWWSRSYKISDDIDFLLVGVKGNIDYNNITTLVNGSSQTYNSNLVISDLEKQVGIVFKEHFQLTSKDCIRLINNSSSKNFNITLTSLNGNSKLNLCARILEEGMIYLTTPSFENINRQEVTKEYVFEDWDKKSDGIKKKSLFMESDCKE